MIRARLAIILLTAVAAASAARAGSPGGEPAPLGPLGCAAEASSVFLETPEGGTFTINAVSEGSTCADALLLATLTGPDGATLWTLESDGRSNFHTQWAETRAEMTAALAEWSEPYGMTSADLPPWEASRTDPGDPDVEFPFFAMEGVTRADYEAARAAELPTVCVVQGLETSRCIALDQRGPTPRVIELGLQIFPG